MNNNPEEDLKKIKFDNHVDSNEVQDLNVDNKGILHLYDGGDLSRNIEVQHDQEDHHNYFGGPVVDKHQPYEHLEGYDKDNIIDKEVMKLLKLLKKYMS